MNSDRQNRSRHSDGREPPQILGFMSWNHLIWVCRDPELHTACPSPRSWKKDRSSDVAPMMAKLAPRWNVAFFALDGGGSGRPSSCAASVMQGMNTIQW
jgi:hypothetical protein